MIALAVAALVCATVPAMLFCTNLRLYRPPPQPREEQTRGVSVLIPARDEEAAIASAVESVLATQGVPFEIIVMDDGSTDRTAEVVLALASEDTRVQLQSAPPLPPGWNGKQHACWALANVARYDLFCFVDADVRLEPAAVARMAAFLCDSHSALVSGFPRQVTITWLERLLLPLIHFLLLGFLPLSRMRAFTQPSLAAGCGQFLIVERQAYFASGGHSAIRHTMHDGLLLPNLLRRHGYRTDLADITELATCRMYRNATQVWNGLAKNATEGIAAPARIVPISLLLVAGQVLPFALAVPVSLTHRMSSPAGLCALVATACAWLPRALAVRRFHQSIASAVLHPIGILVLLALQWYALTRKLMGGAVSWKTRAYRAPV